MAEVGTIPLAISESLEDSVCDEGDDDTSEALPASVASELSSLRSGACSMQHEDSLDNLDSGTGEDFWENGTNDDVTSPVSRTPTSPAQDEGINSPSDDSLSKYSAGLDNSTPHILLNMNNTNTRQSSLDSNSNETTDSDLVDGLNNLPDPEKDPRLISLDLHAMVLTRNITSARTLLENTNAKLRQKVCTMTVSSPKNVMTVAAFEGMVDVLELLSDYGVNLYAYDLSGRAPIHYAALRGHVQAIEFLTRAENISDKCKMLDKMVDIRTIPECYTGLHIAAEEGESVELIELLIQRGANVDARDRYSNTPLHLASKKGSVHIPERLLELGASVNLQNISGETALFCACQQGHAETVSVLSVKGADVNIAQELGWTPLHIAAQKAHTVIIYQLLDLNAKPFYVSQDQTLPVALACRNRLKSAVRRMIFRRGDSPVLHDPDPVILYRIAQLCSADEFSVLKECNVNIDIQNFFKQTALHHAARSGDFNAASVLLSVSAKTDICDNNNNIPLHLALHHRHSEVAKMLILHGSPLNKFNRWRQSCLYLAIRNGNYDLIELLLQNNAEVNSCDPQGRSLLSLAICNDVVQLLEILIHFGANLNQVIMDGLYPLHVAAKLGHTECCKVLLREGLGVNSMDPELWRTPLHLAAEEGHLATVVELLSNGADVNAVNRFNKKPLHLAAGQGHKDVVEVLLDTGTRVLLCDDDGSVEYDLARHQEIWEVIRAWVRANDPSAAPDAPPAYDTVASTARVSSMF